METFSGAIPASTLRELAAAKPNALFTVRYIAVSGGYQTLENFEGMYLDWFNTSSRGVVTLDEETA